MAYRVSREGEVVRVEFVDALTEESIRAYFEELERTVSGLPRYVLLYDFTKAVVPSASIRRRLAAYQEEFAPRLRANCLHIVFVIDAAMLRAALRAMLWLHPMVVRHSIRSNRESAEHLARSVLAGADHAVDTGP